MQDLSVAADGLGMEQKPESLWWTSRCAQVCNIDMNIVVADEIFTFPFKKRGLCFWDIHLR